MPKKRSKSGRSQAEITAAGRRQGKRIYKKSQKAERRKNIVRTAKDVGKEAVTDIAVGVATGGIGTVGRLGAKIAHKAYKAHKAKKVLKAAKKVVGKTPAKKAAAKPKWKKVPRASTKAKPTAQGAAKRAKVIRKAMKEAKPQTKIKSRIPKIPKVKSGGLKKAIASMTSAQAAKRVAGRSIASDVAAGAAASGAVRTIRRRKAAAKRRTPEVATSAAKGAIAGQAMAKRSRKPIKKAKDPRRRLKKGEMRHTTSERKSVLERSKADRRKRATARSRK